MDDDLRPAIRISISALQSIDPADADFVAVVPAIERNASLVSRLASRIAFEDEPSLYTKVIESAKG